jgi:hypothetical protein
VSGLTTSTPKPAFRGFRRCAQGLGAALTLAASALPAATAFSTAGNRGQYVIILPEQELVIVRRGLDWGKQGFDRWDLLREVRKAF